MGQQPVPRKISEHSSNREGQLGGLVELFRFQYQKNYAIVIIGALLAHQQMLLHQQQDPTVHLASAAMDVLLGLLVQYIWFGLGLYGAIYILNGIADRDQDRLHPVKCHRPMASGVVGVRQALGLASALLTLAFAGSYWWERSARFWPIYTGFLLVNGAYALGLRASRWRFVIGVTAGMRVCLGALVVGATLPWRAPVVATLFMCTVQALKIRLETTGRATDHVQGAPLEVMVLWSLVFGVYSVLAGPADSSYRVFLVTSFLSYVFFVAVPWLHPAVAPLTIGADLPLAPKPAPTLRMMSALWAVGDIAGVVRFILLSAWSSLNLSLMWLEDCCLPRSWFVGPPRLVLLLGHQRSGTTHIHQSLANHPVVVTGSLADAACPALTMKPFAWSCQWLLRRLMAVYDNNHHHIRPEESLEEHLWCLHRLKGNALFMLFPSLVRHPEIARIYEEAMSFDEQDVAFAKKCLLRLLKGYHLTGSLPVCKDWVYVGRPLGMTRQWRMVSKAFESTTFVAVHRNPDDVQRSWRQMYLATSGMSPHSQENNEFLQMVHQEYSIPTFSAVRELVVLPEVTPIAFDDWVQDPQNTLNALLLVLIPDHYHQTMLASRTEHDHEGTCGLDSPETQCHG